MHTRAIHTQKEKEGEDVKNSEQENDKQMLYLKSLSRGSTSQNAPLR